MLLWLRGQRTLAGALVALVLATWLGGFCLHCATLAAPPAATAAAAGPCHGPAGPTDPDRLPDDCPCAHAAALAAEPPAAAVVPGAPEFAPVPSRLSPAPRFVVDRRIAPWPPPPVRAVLHPHTRYPRLLT